MFSGVMAAVTLVAAPAHSDPDRRGHGGYEGRGGEHGGGERRGGEGAFRYAPPNHYPGEEGGYRYAPPPSAESYQRAYEPPRRPNSLGSQWREQQEEARSAVREGHMAPLGSVIAGIGHRSAGRPLDAGIEYQGARPVYRVRWLMNNGRRVDYLVDAATGQILSEH
jgi:uncharacterized membrane protein YkoI